MRPHGFFVRPRAESKMHRSIALLQIFELKCPCGPPVVSQSFLLSWSFPFLSALTLLRKTRRTSRPALIPPSASCLWGSTTRCCGVKGRLTRVGEWRGSWLTTWEAKSISSQRRFGEDWSRGVCLAYSVSLSGNFKWPGILLLGATEKLRNNGLWNHLIATSPWWWYLFPSLCSVMLGIGPILVAGFKMTASARKITSWGVKDTLPVASSQKRRHCQPSLYPHCRFYSHGNGHHCALGLSWENHWLLGIEEWRALSGCSLRPCPGHTAAWEWSRYLNKMGVLWGRRMVIMDTMTIKGTICKYHLWSFTMFQDYNISNTPSTSAVKSYCYLVLQRNRLCSKVKIFWYY